MLLTTLRAVNMGSEPDSFCMNRLLWCSYKVEGEEQTATAELRGLRVVTQINLGSSEPSAPTSEVSLQHHSLKTSHVTS